MRWIRDLSDFLDARMTQRKGRNGDQLAARTIIKRISDLHDFFGYCIQKQAVLHDPTVAPRGRRKQLKNAEGRRDRRNLPFTEAQMKSIFSPRP